MIRSYTVSEVESICGVSRRTISEYVAKGLLAGPSHRGRGARYPQADVDVLLLLPRFRALMKREFPSLNSLASFLRQLSLRELQILVRKEAEASFVLEVRRLRLRHRLAALAPHVAPERLEQSIARLSPGQIRAIDSGRYQIGAVINLASLLQEPTYQASGTAPVNGSAAAQSHTVLNGNGHNGNGHAYASGPIDDDSRWTNSGTWSVNWFNGSQTEGEQTFPVAGADDIDRLTQLVARIEEKAAATAAGLRTDTSGTFMAVNLDDTQRDLLALAGSNNPASTEAAVSLGQRLTSLSARLERLEAILESE